MLGYTRKPSARAQTWPRAATLPGRSPGHTGWVDARSAVVVPRLEPRAHPVTDALLSLVIPAYNEELRLPATLTRISDALEQHGGPYEVRVVVNGSTDRTADVVKAAAERDAKIRLIVTPLRG